MAADIRVPADLVSDLAPRRKAWATAHVRANCADLPWWGAPAERRAA
jgi:hypothetical protein